jgi:hypothetical protein
MSSTNIMMSNTCAKCGSLSGLLVDGQVSCADCGANRGMVSDATQQFIANIINRFGDLKEPVVLRKPDALARLKKQDEFLKQKFTRDGKAWFDIITQAAAGLVGDDHPLLDPEDNSHTELP